MPTNPWMRPEPSLTPPERGSKSVPDEAEGERRGLLEIALAVAGVAAWLWCAYEIARTLLH